ncbi:MAG: glycosyltransferase [Chloroflexi bacterium]|nr:glycosyltransferase [Chloroflexota bacterium]
MTPRVSVVVPTCRRPEHLGRCLEALMDQDLDASEYEIIVVDDARSLETHQQVEAMARACELKPEFADMVVPEPDRTDPAQHRGGPRFRYVAVQGSHGPAAARNRGWRVASCPIIAFTDDDCIPHRGWLRAGVDAFRDGVVGVGGRVLVPIPERPTDYERDVARLERGEFVTANCFYRRDALSAVGGFDERFQLAWREDSDVFFRILKSGARLERSDDAVVIHPVRLSTWGVSLRQQRKNLYNALLYKKHPRLYRERIQRPPWRYYRIVAAMLVALAGAAGRRRGLMLGGVLAWAILTGRLCAERLSGSSAAPTHVTEVVATSALIPLLAVFWRVWGAIKYRVFFL